MDVALYLILRQGFREQVSSIVDTSHFLEVQGHPWQLSLGSTKLVSRCLNLPSLRRVTMARATLASHSTTPFTCVPKSLYIDMSPIVSADALTKPYNSASAELSATTACVLHTFDEMRSCNCVSSCGDAACSSATCTIWV